MRLWDVILSCLPARQRRMTTVHLARRLAFETGRIEQLEQRMELMATKKDLDAAISKLNDAITAETGQITRAVASFQQKLADAQVDVDLSAEVAQINQATNRITGFVPGDSDALDPASPTGVAGTEVTSSSPPPTPATPAPGTVPAGIPVDEDGLPLDPEDQADAQDATASPADEGEPGTGRDTVGTDPSSGGTTATGEGDVANP